MADTVNKRFVNITEKLKFKQTETETNEQLTLWEILDGYKDHQNIVKIASQIMTKWIYSHLNLSRLKKYSKLFTFWKTTKDQ